MEWSLRVRLVEFHHLRPVLLWMLFQLRLAFDAELRHRHGLKANRRDCLPTVHADAVGAIIDPFKGSLYLLEFTLRSTHQIDRELLFIRFRCEFGDVARKTRNPPDGVAGG